MRTKHILVASTTFAALFLSGRLALGEFWWCSAGGVARNGMEFSVSGSSYVQDLGLHASAGRSSGDPQGAGPADAFADRTYDDGFVNKDPGTEVDGLGLTWFWGYNDAGQYDAAADTLSFTLGGGSRASREVMTDDAFNDSDDVSGAGFAINAGRDLVIKDAVKIGLACGWQSLWDIESEVQTTTYREKAVTREYGIVDTYALEGVVPPAAPYAGTFDGPGPVIGNLPTSRSQQTTKSSAVEAWNEIDMDTTASLQELWLGPRIDWELADVLSVYVVPFLSLNLVDVDIDRREDFVVNGSVVQTWNDSQSDDDWLFGAGVAVGGRLAISEAWFIDMAVSRDWIEEMNVDVGPNEVTIDGDGYSVMASVGRMF